MNAGAKGRKRCQALYTLGGDAGGRENADANADASADAVSETHAFRELPTGLREDPRGPSPTVPAVARGQRLWGRPVPAPESGVNLQFHVSLVHGRMRPVSARDPELSAEEPVSVSRSDAAGARAGVRVRSAGRNPGRNCASTRAAPTLLPKRNGGRPKQRLVGLGV